MLRSLCALAAAGVVSTSTFAQCNSVLLLEQTSTAAPSSDGYGTSVAMENGFAIIGQPANFPPSPGVAEVVDLSDGSVLHTFHSNSGAADNFGVSVALHGNYAIVGAHTGVGAAYVFDLTTGLQLHMLTQSAGTPTAAGFGVEVAITDDYALVAEPFSGVGGTMPGTVYVYTLDTGALVHTLHAPNPTANDQFGLSIAAFGDRAVIGCPNDDTAGLDAGAAYVFNLSAGTQLLALFSDDLAPADHFGNAVSIDADRALIGAVDADSGFPDTGAAYLFDLTTGDQLQKLAKSDAMTNDHFGSSVALSDDTAILGARELDGDFADTGAAAVFDLQTAQDLYLITPPNPVLGQLFGSSVALEDSRALIGAPGLVFVSLPYRGAAYLYDVPPCTPACQPDLNDDHTLDFSDVQMFLNFYSANDPAADFNTDGLIDFFDALNFLNAFAEGCSF